MLLDKENTFSDDQSLVGAAGVTYSESVINVGAPGTIPPAFQSRGTAPRDVGKGRPVLVLCEVTEDFDSADDLETLKVELYTADDANQTNPVIISSSQAIVHPAKGYQFMVPGVIPPGTGADQHIGLKYTTATSNPTAGKVSAHIVFDKQTSGTV